MELLKGKKTRLSNGHGIIYVMMSVFTRKHKICSYNEDVFWLFNKWKLYRPAVRDRKLREKGPMRNKFME